MVVWPAPFRPRNPTRVRAGRRPAHLRHPRRSQTWITPPATAMRRRARRSSPGRAANSFVRRGVGTRRRTRPVRSSSIAIPSIPPAHPHESDHEPRPDVARPLPPLDGRRSRPLPRLYHRRSRLSPARCLAPSARPRGHGRRRPPWPPLPFSVRVAHLPPRLSDRERLLCVVRPSSPPAGSTSMSPTRPRLQDRPPTHRPPKIRRDPGSSCSAPAKRPFVRPAGRWRGRR